MNFKNLITILGIAATSGMAGCADSNCADSNCADVAATPATQKLFKTMSDLSRKGVMIGHQDALAYGVTWYADDARCDFKEVTGAYPAVFGWEIGGIEVDAQYNLDSVSFEKMKGYIIRAHELGGVNTVSWHSLNPVTGGSTWDVSSKEVVRKIISDEQVRAQYLNWLDKVAAFFADLKDSDGKFIPVIFRPYHEMSGNWFWWGKGLCSSDEYKALWKLTFDYLTQTKQVHHLLWAYSAARFTSEEEFLEFYPGDGYVDIMGYDAYQGTGINDRSAMMKHLNSSTAVLTSVAAKHNKLSAITEIGYESIPEADWFTGLLHPAVSGQGLSYVMLWRNSHDIPNHFYCPYPGHPACEDLIEFVATDNVFTPQKMSPIYR